MDLESDARLFLNTCTPSEYLVGKLFHLIYRFYDRATNVKSANFELAILKVHPSR